MLTKSLVKKMSRQETINYCLKHPPWRIPTGREGEEIDSDEIDWNVFRVDEQISGRDVIYYTKEQFYRLTHPLYLQNVVLVKDK